MTVADDIAPRRQIGRMRYKRITRRLTRSRALWSLAVAGMMCIAAATSASVAQGRVTPGFEVPASSVLDANTLGIATGGGTVTVTAVPQNILASFGINGKRPVGFVQNGLGTALGRINYDKHAQIAAGRHVNVPVTFMTVELSGAPSPNGTGGRAQLIGDCTQANVECPSNTPAFQSVLVYVEDNSDTGANDKFQIQFCTDAPSASINQATCTVAEGGPIRTGQIQIRPSSSGGSAQVPTHVAAPRLQP
jgi:hypothetical protein